MIERISADYRRADDIEFYPGIDNQSTKRMIEEVGKQDIASKCISLIILEIKKQKVQLHDRSHTGPVYRIVPDCGIDVIPNKIVNCTDTRLDGIRKGEDEKLEVDGFGKQPFLGCSLGDCGYQERELHG